MPGVYLSFRLMNHVRHQCNAERCNCEIRREEKNLNIQAPHLQCLIGDDDDDDDDDLLGPLLSLLPNFCSAQEAAGFPPKVLDCAP